MKKKPSFRRTDLDVTRQHPATSQPPASGSTSNARFEAWWAQHATMHSKEAALAAFEAVREIVKPSISHVTLAEIRDDIGRLQVQAREIKTRQRPETEVLDAAPFFDGTPFSEPHDHAPDPGVGSDYFANPGMPDIEDEPCKVEAAPHDWRETPPPVEKPTMSDEAARRKGLPICTGVLDYFPDALLAVAELSRIGNDQHNPGQPLHWSKEKSTDHGDALLRHLIDRGTLDTDGVRHAAKVAWRGLALLQTEIDGETKA